MIPMATHADTEQLRIKLENKYGIEVTEKLFSYIDKVLERNEHINLTAVRDRDEAMQKHLADSLSIADEPELLEAKNIIDIGTGAGFPGALLAIAYPEKSFVLMDSTLKRLKVIDEFARELEIANLKTAHARAEEAQRKEEYSESFDLCVSRAVANLDKLSAWCLPFVRRGGAFAAYKGESYQEEIEQAKKTIKKLGAQVARVVANDELLGAAAEISGHVILMIHK